MWKSTSTKNRCKSSFIRDWGVTFTLREKVEKELASEGFVSPVVSSDWDSPLVVMAKPDGVEII